jgi:hypothetical protein
MSLVNSSLSQYGYEKGFLNIGYVSGYARDFKRTDSGVLRGKYSRRGIFLAWCPLNTGVPID